MWKKLASVGLVASVAMSLVACGSGPMSYSSLESQLQQPTALVNTMTVSRAFEQFKANITQNFQAYAAQVKKQNPKAKIPPMPKDSEIKKEYNKWVKQFEEATEESYNLILSNLKNEDYKKDLERGKKAFDGLEKGEKAPAIQVLKDGKEANLLEEFKGKNILVYCYSTSAPETELNESLKAINKLVEDYKGKNVSVVTVNIDLLNKKEKWNLLLKEQNIQASNFMAANDWDTKFLTDYGFNFHNFPRVILLNSEGNIVLFNAKLASEELKKSLDSVTK